MVQLLGIVGILCCGQVVYSQDRRSVLANFTQAREECDTNGTELPWTSADNTLVEKLQMTNKSATWIDLTISPSPWNWIADNGYSVHYDQGCYNLSSLRVQKAKNNNCTNMYTCMQFCANYLYVGLQSNSSGLICCICTNDMEISLAVSEHKCSGNCSIRQFCGNDQHGTYRLLSTHELSAMTATKETPWKDSPDLNTSISFLCASLLTHPDGHNISISLVPKDCTTNLTALCESDKGTVKGIDQASWFGAQQLCHENGMKLVRVASKYQNNILLSSIGSGWTALRGWTWKSKGDETCDLVPTDWSSGYPRKSDGECITLAKDGSWRNVHCDANMPFVCVTPLNASSPTECGSLNPSTSAKTSYHTAMMETSTTSGQLATTISDLHTTATSDPQATTTPEPHTTATSKLLTSAKSETHRDTSSDPPTPTSSLTEVTHTTPSTDFFTTDGGHASKITSGLGVTGAAVGSVIAFLVLAAVVVIAIVFLRKKKQASSGGSSPHTQRDPGDDKSLRPECDQSMDELPIYARPNKDPLTDGVILVVENSLYGLVDPDDDDLQPSRPVAAAIANGRGQCIAVYELAMGSIGDENNDDSTSGQEAGDLLGSNSSMNDQAQEDDTLMIDNSLYDSTGSAMDGLPVP